MSPLIFPAVLRRARRPGFALIIALVLMGLLLLLTVSLTSLVKTDIQSSNMSETQQLARQNALLGLKVALAELQSTAGADQRVTARADITLAGPATPGDPGFAEIANPYWTGVWQSIPPANHTALEPVAPTGAASAANNGSGHLSPSSAHLINWLVSGNEHKNDASGTPVAYKPDGDLASSADFGQDPAKSAVYLLGASTLVGKGAAPADSVDLKGSVIAPKVALFGEGTDKTGHYAWWVGDEGVKARIQLQETPDIIGKSTDESGRLAFQLPVATDPAIIAELETFFDRTTPELKDLTDFDSLKFAASASDAERLALSGQWHNLSPYSRGLLTDTRWGGLRGDLTLAFENNTIFEKYFGNWDSDDERFYFVALDEFNDYSAKFPNWANLRGFYAQKDRAGIGNGAITAQMASPLQGSGAAVYAQQDTHPYKNSGADSKEGYHGNSPVHPVLSRMQVSVGIRYVLLPGETAPNPAPGQPPLQLYAPVLVIKPLVGLYNPYNVTLEAPAGSADLFYEAALSFSPQITIKVQGRESDATLPLELRDDGVQFYLREVFNSEDFKSDNPGTNPAQALQMQVPRVAIQPGETRMFGLWQNDVQREDYEKAVGSVPLNRLALSTAQNETTPYDHQSGFLLLPLNDSWEAGAIGSVPDAPDAGESRLGLHLDEKRYLKVTANDIIDIEINAGQPGEAWLAASGSVDGINAAENHLQYFGPIGEAGLLAKSKSAPFDIGSAEDKLIEWGFWLRGVNDQATASRLLVDHNIRALTGGQNWDEMNNNFYLTSIYTGELEGNQLHGYLDSDISSSILANADAGGRFTGYWGGSTSGTDGGVDRVVLFDVPRTALISLGALQHANIGRYPTDPTYIIGNSFPPARLGDLRSIHDTGYLSNDTELWDLSYLINQQLWDSYYFSGIPSGISVTDITNLSDGTRQLPNHRLRLFTKGGDNPAPADLTNSNGTADTFYDVASWLLVDGAFNINSTSEDAWAALLSSSTGLRIPVYDLQGGNAGGSPSFQNETDAVYSRLLSPIDGRTTGQNGNTFWRGYRTLTQTEIKDLAAAIVKQIRDREKPFATLAEFVNRPLEISTTGTPARAGLLQEAINAAGLNANVPGGTLSGASLPTALAANNALINDTEASVAFPGYLTQADILQALGPLLSARSDTFTIRSYGDVINPSTGKLESQAWCEAVVQRVPHETLDNGSYLSRSANRKFRVVSFRWLTKDEI